MTHPICDDMRTAALEFIHEFDGAVAIETARREWCDLLLAAARLILTSPEWAAAVAAEMRRGTKDV